MTKDLLENIHKIHTTELGVFRLSRNLNLSAENIVDWCKEKIQKPNAQIYRQGKNYYAKIDDCILTINAHSYTIITAHKIKNGKKNV